MIEIRNIYNDRVRRFSTPEEVGRSLVNGWLIMLDGYSLTVNGKPYSWPRGRLVTVKTGFDGILGLPRDAVVSHLRFIINTEVFFE